MSPQRIKSMSRENDGKPPEKARLLVVSNRLPVRIERAGEEYQFLPSPGGLATSINALRDEREMLWIGWPGIHPEGSSDRQVIEEQLRQAFGCAPIYLPEDTFRKYYDGMSNGCLWPLFHYFT
jgi:trehalose 6-phosphate synthase/phosphatase